MEKVSLIAQDVSAWQIPNFDSLQYLRCLSCNHTNFAVDHNGLICNSCRIHYPVHDGIIDMMCDALTTTSLEKKDYDHQHVINSSSSSHIIAEWTNVLNDLCIDFSSVLEIGGGTGALTEGLLLNSNFRRVVSTDISQKFLKIARHKLLSSQIPNREKNMTFVRCDASTLPFAAQSFSCVAGRSILHHLIDYELTLKRVLDILTPGGTAIFFEPVIEGKQIIAFMLELILGADLSSSTPVLTASERNKIRATVRHITKAAWIAPELLDGIEDKYIFSVEKMKQLAIRIGFSQSSFIKPANIDSSYHTYLRNTLLLIGVQPNKIKSFAWIAEAMKSTIGLLQGSELVAPMGFFAFTKA